jgi:hypothetical protein
MAERSAEAQWQVTCVCGWRTHGTKDAVVVAVQDHGKTKHGQDLTPEQVMQQAVAYAS